MQLLIDTTQKGQILFELWDRSSQIANFQKETEKLSEEILLELNQFLKRNKISLKQATKISVNPGPGAFSSTRTGVAVANALALALGIPVAEWPSGTMKEAVLPKYDREPNITKPTKESPPREGEIKRGL
ncbi:MAG: hypothetical protein Q8R08_02110 [bacterium]|nr:hypothetical protein [bacterium]